MRSREFLRAIPLAFIALAIALPATGQGEGDDGLASIESITVTITKREESLQDVAASVSAFDAQTIEDVNIENVSDLATLLPGVVTKGEDRTGNISIRGVSSGFTGQSAVARHINGVYKRLPLSYSGQYYDVEAIEVQRGPVGTVYGRNATAGALNLKQKKPHSEYEAFADFTYGNYDLYQMQGGVNVPVFGAGDERLMARIVFQREIRDGYLDNANLPDSRDPQDKDEWSLRASLLSRPTEDLEVAVRAFWVESDAEPNTMAPLPGQTAYPVGAFSALDRIFGAGAPIDIFNGLQGAIAHGLANPGIGPGQSSIGQIALGLPGNPVANFQNLLVNGFPPGSPTPLIPGVVTDFSFFTPAAPLDGRDFFTRSTFFQRAQSHLEIYGIDGEVDQHLGDDIPLLGSVDFVVSGGWEWLRIDQVTDADGTELAIVDSASMGRTNEVFTADARFVTTGEAFPVDFVFGYFFVRHDQDGGTDSITPFGVFSGTSRSFEQGEAIYGSATVHLADAMSAIGIPEFLSADVFGGARYNKDEEFLDQENLPSPLRAASSFNDDVTFREVTWETGARLFVGDDHTIYGKFSKGYKPGFQQLDLGLGVAVPVESEIIRGWELGWKSTWLEGRLTANLAIFDYAYSNLQVPQLLATQVFTRNAASASSSGVELETRYLVSEDWVLSANIGYLDATYDDFCADDAAQFNVLPEAGCGMRGELNLKGNDLEDAPEWKFSLVSIYTFDIGEWGTLTPILKFTWTDDYFLRPFNLAIDEVDSYTRTDLRLRWEGADQRYSIEIFVENLEDEKIFAQTTVGQEFAGGFAASLGGLPPRVYGIRLGLKWGND